MGSGREAQEGEGICIHITDSLCCIEETNTKLWASQVVLVVKNPPTNAVWRWDMPVRSLGQEDPLEKGMAIHSSILAWTIPWSEEPGRLQFIGLHRVRHDWNHLVHSTQHNSVKQLCLNLKKRSDSSFFFISRVENWQLMGLYICLYKCLYVWMHVYMYFEPG